MKMSAIMLMWIAGCGLVVIDPDPYNSDAGTDAPECVDHPPIFCDDEYVGWAVECVVDCVTQDKTCCKSPAVPACWADAKPMGPHPPDACDGY